MALEITYFGTFADGDTVYFGSSTYFGYTYDSDTFDTDTFNDVNDILLETGVPVYIRQQSETTDSYGEITATSQDQNIMAYVRFDDITRKDRKIHDMGLAVPGNRKMFALPYYENTSYEVREDDIVVDLENSDRQWRVIKILHQHQINDTEVLRCCIVRRIGLQGSE